MGRQYLWQLVNEKWWYLSKPFQNITSVGPDLKNGIGQNLLDSLASELPTFQDIEHNGGSVVED